MLCLIFVNVLKLTTSRGGRGVWNLIFYLCISSHTWCTMDGYAETCWNAEKFRFCMQKCRKILHTLSAFRTRKLSAFSAYAEMLKMLKLEISPLSAFRHMPACQNAASDHACRNMLKVLKMQKHAEADRNQILHFQHMPNAENAESDTFSIFRICRNAENAETRNFRTFNISRKCRKCWMLHSAYLWILSIWELSAYTECRDNMFLHFQHARSEEGSGVSMRGHRQVKFSTCRKKISAWNCVFCICNAENAECTTNSTFCIFSMHGRRGPECQCGGIDRWNLQHAEKIFPHAENAESAKMTQLNKNWVSAFSAFSACVVRGVRSVNVGSWESIWGHRQVKFSTCGNCVFCMQKMQKVQKWQLSKSVL